MRKGLLLLAAGAVGATAQPAWSQTRVMVRQDTALLRIADGPPSAQGVRVLWSRIQELQARNTQAAAEWNRLSTDTTSVNRARTVALVEEIATRTFQLLSAQSDLAGVCARLRSTDGEPGTLGFTVDTPVQFELRRSETGHSLTMAFSGSLRIASVEANSPADKAGVRVGDVWESVNGKQLVGNVRIDELLTPGSPVTIRVLRDGRERELPQMHVAARASDYPDECHAVADFDALPSPLMERLRVPLTEPGTVRPQPRPARAMGMGQLFIVQPMVASAYGVALEPLDDEWRRAISVQGEGLVVVSVASDLHADRAGLRKFEVIREVNGEVITSSPAFQRAALNSRTLVLTVYNKDLNTTRTVTITR